MESQIPFTGGSGRVLDRSLPIAGIAKHEIFVTNVVNPVTRPTTALRAPTRSRTASLIYTVSLRSSSQGWISAWGETLKMH